MDVLGIIPARGRSKGIPRKNIRNFLGKPLLGWTVEAARASTVLTRVLVSTDDEEIAKAASAYGADVPFLRPRALALDQTPTAPVVRHAIEWIKDHGQHVPDAVMVLEPTSPGRRPFHIHEAAQLLDTSGAESVASISEVPHHYAPSKVLELCGDGTIIGVGGVRVRDMVHRRQELPTHYALNGLIFVCKTALVMQDPPTLWGERVMGYRVDSAYAVDIDRPEDWTVAEAKLYSLLSSPECLAPRHPARRLPEASDGR